MNGAVRGRLPASDAHVSDLRLCQIGAKGAPCERRGMGSFVSFADALTSCAPSADAALSIETSEVQLWRRDQSCGALALPRPRPQLPNIAVQRQHSGFLVNPLSAI